MPAARTLLTLPTISATIAQEGAENRLNRGNGRAAIFVKDGDYEAFERVMVKALEHVPGMRLVASCPTIGTWSCGRGPMANFPISGIG